MTSKTIDGVEIRTYSVRKDFSEKRERQITIAILAIMLLFSLVFAGEFGTTNFLIEATGKFISSIN